MVKCWLWRVKYKMYVEGSGPLAWLLVPNDHLVLWQGPNETGCMHLVTLSPLSVYLSNSTLGYLEHQSACYLLYWCTCIEKQSTLMAVLVWGLSPLVAVTWRLASHNGAVTITHEQGLDGEVDVSLRVMWCDIRSTVMFPPSSLPRCKPATLIVPLSTWPSNPVTHSQLVAALLYIYWPF